MDRDALEEQLRELPLYCYRWIEPEQLSFSDRVRYICETECPMYGKSWACPPAVGTVEACRTRCRSFPGALAFSTITEVDDISDLRQTLETRADHEDITRQVHRLIRQSSRETFVLSTEACTICKECTYPHAPCRFPDRMYPCVESQGILVTELADLCGIDFMAGGNLVTWFSLILYRE